MKGDHIKYSTGYKYQLRDDYRVETPIKDVFASTQYVVLELDGWLTIGRGYAWDGPSGPTYDSKDSMRASLIHDAIYQLIRLGHLDHSCKAIADNVFHAILDEDGMCDLRSAAWYLGVSWFADFAAKPWNEPEILTAP